MGKTVKALRFPASNEHAPIFEKVADLCGRIEGIAEREMPAWHQTTVVLWNDGDFQIGITRHDKSDFRYDILWDKGVLHWFEYDETDGKVTTPDPNFSYAETKHGLPDFKPQGGVFVLGKPLESIVSHLSSLMESRYLGLPYTVKAEYYALGYFCVKCQNTRMTIGDGKRTLQKTEFLYGLYDEVCMLESETTSTAPPSAPKYYTNTNTASHPTP